MLLSSSLESILVKLELNGIIIFGIFLDVLESVYKIIVLEVKLDIG